MWIVLGAVAFLAGQVYLLRSLKKMDRLLEQQAPEREERKKVLSIAFSDPAAAERIAQLLEGFSVRYPDLEIVLRSGPDAADAVWDGTAEVALLPAGRSLPRGLSRLALHTDAMPGQEIVWKRVAPVSPGDCFVEYLWEQGAVGSGNSGQNVV